MKDEYKVVRVLSNSTIYIAAENDKIKLCMHDGISAYHLANEQARSICISLSAFFMCLFVFCPLAWSG